ncbi:uncharacterized protein LOC110990285 isoform X2 [Acanthaster planci]|uniref:Uncharacterized protein LOC110990285 isoform X2 n=1 Tax=Acanthaster planci TaxID=133434 RepID=A0A8B8A0J6_ACAPL|nr:uncharacterized protein LOC110990285 isoform X2 [Acanthaster planci]
MTPSNLGFHLLGSSSFGIEQDFAILHPDAANNLYSKWPTLSEHLLTYCPKASPSWESLVLEQDIELENLTSEQRKNLAVLVLPILFTGRRKGKGGQINFSESSRAFMDFQKTQAWSST